MGLDASEGISIIQQAVEKEQEEKVWQLWVSLYPNFTKENYIPFDRFLADATRPAQTNKKKNVIDMVKRAEQIRRADQRGGRKRASI